MFLCGSRTATLNIPRSCNKLALLHSAVLHLHPSNDGPEWKHVSGWLMTVGTAQREAHHYHLHNARDWLETISFFVPTCWTMSEFWLPLKNSTGHFVRSKELLAKLRWTHEVAYKKLLENWCNKEFPSFLLPKILSLFQELTIWAKIGSMHQVSI